MLIQPEEPDRHGVLAKIHTVLHKAAGARAQQGRVNTFERPRTLVHRASPLLLTLHVVQSVELPGRAACMLGACCCELLTLLHSWQGRHGSLLLSSQKLTQAVEGHLSVDQLADQLWELEEGHAQHLRASQAHW